MGLKLKQFNMKVRKDNTQEFEDIGLLGSDVEGEIEAVKDKISGIVTPEQFGAIGDGITDDSNAFVSLANIQNVSVVIPPKRYLLNRRIVISGNVISDKGIYSKYVPEYAKPLKLEISNLTYGDNISLPEVNSYAESITYISGKYYVLCKQTDITPNRNYIAVYDENFTYQSIVYTDQAYGISDSSCTDGEYLYIDFNTGYHCKYDPSNLTNVVKAVQNSDFRFVEFYNGQFYAIAINTSNITVSKIDNAFEVLSDSWSVTTDIQTLQSATIYNGQLYVPTTLGLFKLIDLVSHDIIEVKYMLLKEVEKFFSGPNNKLLVMGHIYGFNGVFNIGDMSGGIDTDIINYVPLDGSAGSFGITAKNRANVYNISNGLAAGFPLDNCDVIVLDHMILAVSRSDNALYTYANDGTWRYMGTIAPANANISGNIYLSYDVGGGFSIFSNGYRLNSENVLINYDFSTVYSRCGFADDRTFSSTFLARPYGNSFLNGNVHAINMTITKNAIQFETKNITDPSAGVNAYALFRVKIW